MVSESADLQRIEAKVDRLTEAINDLVRIEERLANQGMRIGIVEERIATTETVSRAVEKKMDQWINRGLGMWGVVIVIFSVYKAMRP